MEDHSKMYANGVYVAQAYEEGVSTSGGGGEVGDLTALKGSLVCSLVVATRAVGNFATATMTRSTP